MEVRSFSSSLYDLQRSKAPFDALEWAKAPVVSAWGLTSNRPCTRTEVKVFGSVIYVSHHIHISPLGNRHCPKCNCSSGLDSQITHRVSHVERASQMQVQAVTGQGSAGVIILVSWWTPLCRFRGEAVTNNTWVELSPSPIHSSDGAWINSALAHRMTRPVLTEGVIHS